MSRQPPSLPDERRAETKKLRSCEPDMIIEVGQGDGRQRFKFYSVLFALGGPVMDSLVLRNVRERDDKTLRLPQFTGDQWQEFAPFLDPSAAVIAGGESEITPANVRLLLPMFHYFDMTECLEKCDDAMRFLASNRDRKPRNDDTETVLEDLLEISVESAKYDMTNAKKESFSRFRNFLYAHLDVIRHCHVEKMIELAGWETRMWFILIRWCPGEMHFLRDELEQNPLLSYLVLSGIRAEVLRKRVK